jgi:hypothetical protein
LANEQREKDVELKKLAESSKYQKLTTFFAGPTDRARIEQAPAKIAYMNTPTLASKIQQEMTGKFGNSFNERPLYTKLLFRQTMEMMQEFYKQ